MATRVRPDAVSRVSRMLQQRTRCLRRKLKGEQPSIMDVRMSAMTAILIAALGLSPRAHAQTSGGSVLTLDEAISLARSNNRDLKQYGFDIGKRREALGAAKSELYPRFDASVLAAQLLTPIDFTQRRGRFRGLTPIFTLPLGQ